MVIYTKGWGKPRPFAFLQFLYIDLKRLFRIKGDVVSFVALKSLRAAPVLLAIELAKVAVPLQCVAVGSHAGLDPAAASVNDLSLFHQTNLSVNPSFSKMVHINALGVFEELQMVPYLTRVAEVSRLLVVVIARLTLLICASYRHIVGFDLVNPAQQLFSF